MSRGAQVTSIDAVREMAAVLASFRTEMAAALDELEMEIRRAQEWIHHDRKQHWDSEARRGMERVTEARIQLQQAMTAKRVADHEPSCQDEKKALARAKRRWELAESKKEVVRHWQRAIDHAVNEYRGARTPLSGWLEADVPRALAAVQRLAQSLESYVALDIPAGLARPMELPAAGAVASVARPGAEDAAPPRAAAAGTPAASAPQAAPAQAEPAPDALPTETAP
jgi:hypothetical protein